MDKQNQTILQPPLTPSERTSIMGGPKYKKDGCDQEDEDEVIAEHEVECGFRKVRCLIAGCPPQSARDFVEHIFTAHQGTIH